MGRAATDHDPQVRTRSTTPMTDPLATDRRTLAAAGLCARVLAGASWLTALLPFVWAGATTDSNAMRIAWFCVIVLALVASVPGGLYLAAASGLARRRTWAAVNLIVVAVPHAAVAGWVGLTLVRPATAPARPLTPDAFEVSLLRAAVATLALAGTGVVLGCFAVGAIRRLSAIGSPVGFAPGFAPAQPAEPQDAAPDPESE